MQTVDDHSASITSVKFNGMCVTRVAESKCHGKWFEPRGISYLFGVIVRVKVVFDWRFNYLSGSHLQSQVKSRRQMMVFMPLVVVWIGQFCRDVIGCQNVRVVMIGRL